MQSRLSTILCLVALSSSFLSCAKKAHEPLLVFAAASLAGPMDSVLTSFTETTGTPVLVTYGASGTLAQQIRIGADAAVFVSADTTWARQLVDDPKIKAVEWRPFLRNRLVMAALAGNGATPSFPDAMQALSLTHIAIADPESAPAGRYARAYLENVGLWERLRPRLLIREDVRATLNVVRLGIADIGIVYATDVASTPGVKIAAELPDSLYPPALYGAVLLKRGPQEKALFEHLFSASSSLQFRRVGFRTEPGP
jgi:molybdate transport system substrate-binding protein